MTGHADRADNAADGTGTGGRDGSGGPAGRDGGGGPDGSGGPGGAAAARGGSGGSDRSGRSGGSGGSGRFGRFDRWKAVASRYSLLPLRIFLGVTFIYAGLDKLTDSAFFADTGSGSIGETMRGVRDTSAIPALVDLALNNPTGFGYAIAFGELAVGIGTLLGLFARLAALGGALISLSLWLTVSWQVNPYYLGNDLAYLMAWLPLVLAGASVLSVDRLLAERRRMP
ncbi:DoxX family protein [Streptomyces venezuelae]|uniref:DoxX family protein n=1 Tax=Streptomyces venezuelae TaxID=54571 RepID=UPI0012385910|nr:DoxX family protein [Streptomyces venezuelae]